MCGDAYVMLCGDLNARTSNVSHHCQNGNIVDFQHMSHPVSVGRTSEDRELNNYGKLLINMSTAFDLCILNGVCHGDLQGRYTYVSESGSSVNDYFLLSCDLFGYICDVCELNVSERIESDHMSLEFYVRLRTSNGKFQENDKIITMEKFIWDDAKADEYNDLLCSDELKQKLQDAVNLMDVNVDEALNIFNGCIRQAADSMRKEIGSNKHRRNDWYDYECIISKRNVRKLLKKFCRTLDALDRDSFCKARREYKNLLKQKKKQFNDAMLHELVNSIKSQKDFWDNMHKISFNRKQPPNNISTEDWFMHFKNLLEKNITEKDYFTSTEEEEEEENNLNRKISKEEVIFALSKLKNRKAAGPDGIIGELLKNACRSELILDFLVRFFNSLFDKGIFPEIWTESIVLPLYKKGNVDNPNNYRGISLCDASSKLYSTIINRRLQEWVDENNITGEFQAGFKRNYSTVDHMFTLLACVQKQFSLNRKLYVAFIDFEKAFDSINRSILWPILLKNGVCGKLFRSIKSMYNCVKARVRSGGKLTDYINCTAGVKQGDVCSPVLFSLFINDLTSEITRYGRHGVQLSGNALELFILLLADDVVLLSETVVGLQTQLSNLRRAAESLQLKVNMSKSNIIVFRKGGYLSARERWFYDGNVMPVVNVYKYLGVYFSTRLSFVVACKDLASRGKHAFMCIFQKLSLLKNYSLEILMKLFDSQVQPIVQYGAELWGLDTVAASHCEKVHLFALKKFLGVSMKTPNDVVYGETGRYPIYLNSVIRCISYWLKLTCMEDSRIPKKAYNMLRDLDVKGKMNWVSRIRLKLFEYGFGFVWLCQGVGDVNHFIYAFRQRLIDCRWQEWSAHIQESDRFFMYGLFNPIPSTPSYLKMNMNPRLRYVMARFRLGVSNILVHSRRYNVNAESDLICPLCRGAKEDEIHFVLCCPMLNDLRLNLIPRKYYVQPSLFRLILLMSTTQEHIVKQLALFLSRAFQVRDTVTS